MLNSVGLENPGMAAWLADELPALAATGARVVASIWGFTVADFRRAAAVLADAAARTGGAAARPAASSRSRPTSPVRTSRTAGTCSPTVEASAAAAVDAATAGLASSGLPLWVKLSPNVTDLPAIAGAVLEAGAEALTLVNTLMGLALDPATGRTVLGGGGGGLSGPALHPVAVRAVFECRAGPSPRRRSSVSEG